MSPKKLEQYLNLEDAFKKYTNLVTLHEAFITRLSILRGPFSEEFKIHFCRFQNNREWGGGQMYQFIPWSDPIMIIFVFKFILLCS